MARLLFLHHNFPGQFGFIAEARAEAGDDVVFLTERNLCGQIKGVRQIAVGNNEKMSHNSLGGQIACGKRFKEKLLELKGSGWEPDVVVSHSGWGCGLKVHEVFPETRRIAYLEWWFDSNAKEYDFDRENVWWRYTEKLKEVLQERNMTVGLELAYADVIVSPTEWQKSQLPIRLQKDCKVIHEGVDINFFRSNPAWKSEDKVRITYATRGMEPMRGFPEFIRSLPGVLDKRDEVEVIIAGNDRVAYGSRVPKEGSFGKWAKSYLADWVANGRVRFVGHLPIVEYARLLKSSDVHCYLTRPYVVSWSLLEAMASGCCLVASDVDPVREVAHASDTLWVDHTNVDSLKNVLDEACSLEKNIRAHLGESQRKAVETSWNRASSVIRWSELLAD